MVFGNYAIMEAKVALGLRQNVDELHSHDRRRQLLVPRLRFGQESVDPQVGRFEEWNEAMNRVG